MSSYANLSQEQKDARVARQRERRQEKKAAGHCRDCSSLEVFRGSRCKRCYKTALSITLPIIRQRRLRLLEAGLCTWCGKRKARKKRTTCKTCSDKYSKRRT